MTQTKHIYPISLYVDKKDYNHPSRLYAKQYDAQTRYINATIKSHYGQVPIEGLAQLNAQKPDGTYYYANGIINNDNTVTVELTSQLLSAAGTVSCDISIFAQDNDDIAILTTSTFYIEVEKSNYDTDAIESSNEYSVVTEDIFKAEKYSQDAQDAAKRAEDSLEEITSISSDIGDISEQVAECAERAEQAKSEAENAAQKAASVLSDEIAERERCDKNLQDNLNTEHADRIEAQTSLRTDINKVTDRVGLSSDIGTALFTVMQVGLSHNNFVEVHLLMAHGGVFEVRTASLFFWGAKADNATLSDGVSFSIPVEIYHDPAYVHYPLGYMSIHFEKINVFNSDYQYTGVGKLFIQSI